MPDPLLLDRLLLVSHLFQRDMARAFAGTELSEARMAVLWTVHHAGPATQQAIAAALDLTPRTVSAHVDVLEASGHVHRAPHPHDRRAHLVGLTTAGAALMDRTAAEHAELSDTLRSAVAPADRDALERGLDAVTARLRELITEVEAGASAEARDVSRRPAIAPGAEGFRSDEPVRMILFVFIGLSAVEIPIIDLIVHPWPAVRIPLLVLGIWGLTWMIGLLCAYRMRPHTVGPTGLRVREGLEIDIPLSWDDIASIAPRRRVDEPKSPRISESDGLVSLSLRMQDTTNVEVVLERPTALTLPGLHPRGGRHEVSVVRFWVDDLEAYLAAVRRHIP
ncbi:MAG: MarR family transcriptional regulator [Microbacterium sp.]|nr:MAG: MarR family transcriptional regulator [Microbacterium sp.]